MKPASEIQGEWVEWPVDGVSMSGYIARPSGEARGPVPAVIVCMELFGVTAHVRDVTERVARLGYVALAPEFYHRAAPHTDLPHDAAGRERGMALIDAMERAEVVRDFDATLAYLRARPDVSGPVGVLGFSLGGHLACLAAASCDVAVTASFYPGWLTTTEKGIGRPTPTVESLPHVRDRGGRLALFFGGKDHLITPDQVQLVRRTIEEAGVRGEVIVYEGATHGFFCDQRPTFDAPSRDAAWARVQALFEEELRPAAAR
jgi:carboxymethylenebutenolidase